MSTTINTEKAASRLDVSGRQVQNYIKQGDLKAEKEGGSYQIDSVDFYDFLAKKQGEDVAATAQTLEKRLGIEDYEIHPLKRGKKVIFDFGPEGNYNTYSIRIGEEMREDFRCLKILNGFNKPIIHSDNQELRSDLFEYLNEVNRKCRYKACLVETPPKNEERVALNVSLIFHEEISQKVLDGVLYDLCEQAEEMSPELIKLVGEHLE